MRSRDVRAPLSRARKALPYSAWSLTMTRGSDCQAVCQPRAPSPQLVLVRKAYASWLHAAPLRSPWAPELGACCTRPHRAGGGAS